MTAQQGQQAHIEALTGTPGWLVQKGKRRTAYVGHTQLEVLQREKERGDEE